MCSPGWTCRNPHTAGGNQLFPSPTAPGLVLEQSCACAGGCPCPVPAARSCLPCPARATASLGTADGSGKACRWPLVLKPLIRDLAGQQGKVCLAFGGMVDVFWVHLITRVCFPFLQHVAQEPSSLSRGKVPALPALPTAGPPQEQQQSARVETAFSGQTWTPQTAPAPVSPALGEEGRQGELWRWWGSTSGAGGVCCAHARGEPGMGARHP